MFAISFQCQLTEYIYIALSDLVFYAPAARGRADATSTAHVGTLRYSSLLHIPGRSPDCIAHYEFIV